eukprot:scaffold7072_cov267-Pinguiococcus_pyrenoidosus.AAC.5
MNCAGIHRPQLLKTVVSHSSRSFCGMSSTRPSRVIITQKKTGMIIGAKTNWSSATRRISDAELTPGYRRRRKAYHWRWRSSPSLSVSGTVATCATASPADPINAAVNALVASGCFRRKSKYLARLVRRRAVTKQALQNAPFERSSSRPYGTLPAGAGRPGQAFLEAAVVERNEGPPPPQPHPGSHGRSVRIRRRPGGDTR